MRMHPRRAGAYSSVARGVSAAMRGSGGSDFNSDGPLWIMGLLLFLALFGATHSRAIRVLFLVIFFGVVIAQIPTQMKRAKKREVENAMLASLPPVTFPPPSLMVYHNYAFTLYSSGGLGISAPEEALVTLRRREVGGMEVDLKRSNSPYGETQGIDSLTLRTTDCNGATHAYPLLSYRVSEGSWTYDKTIALAAWLQSLKCGALS